MCSFQRVMFLHPRLKLQPTTTLMLTTRISSSLIYLLHGQSMVQSYRCFLLLFNVKNRSLPSFISSNKSKTKDWLKSNESCKLFEIKSRTGLRLKDNQQPTISSSLLQMFLKVQTTYQTFLHLKLLQVFKIQKELQRKKKRSQWLTTWLNSV